MIRAGLGQIVSGMRYRRSAYASLVLEVALGCTVVVYILALSQALKEIALAPIGLDEKRTFTVAFEQAPDTPAQTERGARELAELRALPGVAAAAFVEQPPLSRFELPEQFTTPVGERLVWSLRGDEHLLDALGVEPSVGRGLLASDALVAGPRPVVVTRALADRFGREPIGKTILSRGDGALSIVGVIDAPIRLGPFYERKSELAIMLAPASHARRTAYLVRTAEDAPAFTREAQTALAAADAQRFVHVERLCDAREYYIRNVGGANTIIFITVFGMVMVVLVGSVGMASSLIVERARQVGIRRALGARRADIAAYFMLENLLATGLGLLLGTGLCAVLDKLMEPIKGALVLDWPAYLKVAAVLFLVSGQLAVLFPARRASRIAPSVASRPA